MRNFFSCSANFNVIPEDHRTSIALEAVNERSITNGFERSPSHQRPKLKLDPNNGIDMDTSAISEAGVRHETLNCTGHVTRSSGRQQVMGAVGVRASNERCKPYSDTNPLTKGIPRISN